MATLAKEIAGLSKREIATPGLQTADLDPSSFQLATLVDQINNATLDARKLVSRHSAADLVCRPDAGSWSVAECLDHVAQTTFAFLPAIQNAITSAPALPMPRGLRAGMLARLFVRNLAPPYRIRLKVLPQLAPQCTGFDSSWNKFLEAQSQLIETVHSARGLAIDRVKVKSPIYARLSYNVYGALCILAAHERRHLWQVERTLRAFDAQLTEKSLRLSI
jgi:hypothetical protein